MSAFLPAPARAAAAPAAAAFVARGDASRKLERGTLFCLGLSSCFVFIEPSPYEIASIMAIFVFMLTGFRLTVAMMPLIFLLILINVGFSFATIDVAHKENRVIWTLVSWFLGATTIFFCAACLDDTKARLDAYLKGYLGAAMIASIAGIIGYFSLLPGSEWFTRYGRAQGTFNDPNVMGPFLILPMLMLFHTMLVGEARRFLPSACLFMVLLAALLLTFSRGAWGHFIFSALLTYGLTFAIAGSGRDRLRMILLAVASIMALGLLIAVLLSIDKVGALFTERASLTQSYDAGHLGRFGRHILGFQLALDYPFGIGPFEFIRFFPEAPHNVYLNALVTGGFLSGITYLVLVLLTLGLGARYVLRDVPWRPIFITTYATFLGVALEGLIIDTDHWRHFWLLMGLIWGMALAAHRSPALPRRTG